MAQLNRFSDNDSDNEASIIIPAFIYGGRGPRCLLNGKAFQPVP